MDFKEREFAAALLGSDINTYSVARAFYEEYQIKSYVFGKYWTGPSLNSKIVEYQGNPQMDTEEVFLSYISDLASRLSNKKIFLLGCGDNYVTLIGKCKEKLPENVITPYISIDLMEKLVDKERFYELCEKLGVDYPSTIIYKPEMGHDFDIPFEYPLILKPANSVDYFAHSFEGQNKIYKLSSRKEVDETIDKIYQAGYSSRLIIQDMIPGNDENMRVLTSYSGRDKKVKMMCLGHVLLEEHTPLGLGNHALIITEDNQDLYQKARMLLEEIGYTGFSNFDIKYDPRDGKYKFFEINVRQGRSNYYVTNAGFNIARYLVDDYIYEKDLGFVTCANPSLWMVVPKGVAFKYVKSEESKQQMKELIAQNKMANPLFMRGDLSFKRFSHLAVNHLRQFKNFKTYYK